MFAKLLCRLGFHDWWPVEQPRSVGFCSEAQCECIRCHRRENIVMAFTDELDVKYWDYCNAKNYEYYKARGELPGEGIPIPEGEPLF